MKRNSDYVNKVLITRLKNQIGNARIKFPAYIKFRDVEQGMSVIRMHIGRNKNQKACVTSNMQEDSAAFEGWVLALKANIPELKEIKLTWDIPEDRTNKHYQRFLYRVYKFQKAFGDWFSAAPSFESSLRIKFNKPDGYYKLNVPSKMRNTNVQSRYKEGERGLESSFIIDDGLRARLKAMAGIDVIGNQLPIGVFEWEVKEAAAIFTGQASAIDLWGVNAQGNELSIFELKLPDNKKVGVVSESFFYAMVMKDLINGFFSFGKEKRKDVVPWPGDYIQKGKIKRIKTYILMSEPHCLVNGDVLGILNRAFCSEEVSFHHMDYTKLSDR